MTYLRVVHKACLSVSTIPDGLSTGLFTSFPGFSRIIHRVIHIIGFILETAGLRANEHAGKDQRGNHDFQIAGLVLPAQDGDERGDHGLPQVQMPTVVGFSFFRFPATHK